MKKWAFVGFKAWVRHEREGYQPKTPSGGVCDMWWVGTNGLMFYMWFTFNVLDSTFSRPFCTLPFELPGIYGVVTARAARAAFLRK